MAFPTSIEAATYFLIAYNNLATALTQTCGIADTTVYVTSTDNFPTAGWFTVEDEVREYTGKTSNTFTGCTPASDNTVAAEHASGKAVSLTIPAVAWNRVVTELRAALTAIGTTAAPNFVKNTGNSTVAGIKTFSSSPIVPTPTTDMQTSTKLYVDGEIDKEGLYATTITTHATPTPARGSKRNLFTVTAQGEAAAFAIPSGTPAEGDTLLIRIKDDATARALTWNAIYRVMMTALPSTTILSKTMYILFVYNNTDSKWDCMAAGSEA